MAGFDWQTGNGRLKLSWYLRHNYCLIFMVSVLGVAVSMTVTGCFQNRVDNVKIIGL